MNQTNNAQSKYSIPIRFRTGYTLKMHLTFLIAILLFIYFSLKPTEEIRELLAKVFTIPLSLALTYCWLYFGVLRLGFLKIEEDGIAFRILFKRKGFKWNEISGVKSYAVGNNFYIGLITRQKRSPQKSNFITSLNQMLGGGYDFAIPLGIFPGINPELLHAAIFSAVHENEQGRCREEKSTATFNFVEKHEKEKKNYFSLTVLKAFAVSILTGLIYGVTLYFFSVNLPVLPVIGSMGIAYIFRKNEQTKARRFLLRLFRGIFYMLPFFIAVMVDLMLLNKSLIETSGFLKTLMACAVYLIIKPMDHLIYLVLGTLFFLFGVFQDYSSYKTRFIRKLFLKRQNGFLIKKEKRNLSIYLADYAKCDEQEEKLVASINPNLCLIEREKKRVVAFYIPERILVDLDIKVDRSLLKKEYIRNEMYHKLDLGGGHAERRLYGYYTNLILSKNNLLEQVVLELDS